MSFKSLNERTLLEKTPSKYVRTYSFPTGITVPTWNLMLENNDLILGEFQWKDDIKDKVKRRLDSLTANRTFSKLVAIHNQRTDYNNFVDLLYGASRRLTDESYFRRAKEIYQKEYGNPLFLVFSDDLEWCTNHLAADDVVFSGDVNQDNLGFDLAMLSSFDHVVLSHGAFAVIAAYLSGAEVFIPDKYSATESIKQVSKFSRWTWLPI